MSGFLKRFLLQVVMLLLVACAATNQNIVAAGGKPLTAPVDVEFSPPPADARAGDVIDTDIRVRATENLDRLEVTVRPFFGLQLLSDTSQVVVTNVSRGDGPLLKVRVRLTEASGSLAVTVSTLAASTKQEDAAAITIEYGSGQ